MRLAAGFRWRMGRGGGRDPGDGRGRRDFRLASASRRVVRRRSRGTHAICCGSGCSGSDRRRGRRAVARWNGGREWFRRHGLGLREVCGQSVFAALTRSGRKVGAGRRERCVDRERTVRHRARGGAEVKGAFANQPPDGRRLGARGDGCAAGLGSRRFRCSRSERRRVVRGLRTLIHRRGGAQRKRQRRQKRAVVEQRMSGRLSGRRLFLSRFFGRMRLSLGGRSARFRRCARNRIEHGGEGEAIGRRLGRRARRGWRDRPRSRRGGGRGHGEPPFCVCTRLDVRRSAACACSIVSAGPLALFLSPSPKAAGSCVLTTPISGAIRNSAAARRAAASRLASARSSFVADRVRKSAIAASYASENRRLAAR